MKAQNLFLLLLVVLSFGCKKEEIIPANYLKATIDGEPLIVYQNNQLNKDTIPNTFNFSFGQIISNKTDTLLFFQACLNWNNLYIAFPKPIEEQRFVIYRQSNIQGQPYAFYSVIPKYAEETDLETFETWNVMDVEGFIGQEVGEITIDKIDYKRRIIKGNFNFTGFGYKIVSDTYVPTKNVKTISDGEFYFQWDESLQL